MHYIFLICISLILVSSCSSGNSVSELEQIEKAKDVQIEDNAKIANTAPQSVLGGVLENPNVYLNKTLALKGMIDAVEFRKVGRHTHVVNFKLIPEERIDEWAQIRYDAEKYTFINVYFKMYSTTSFGSMGSWAPWGPLVAFNIFVCLFTMLFIYLIGYLFIYMFLEKYICIYRLY